MKRYFVLFGLVLTSCATIVNGPTEDVPVTTDPPGASVSVEGATKQTPADFVLDRDRDYLLTITMAGFQPENIKIVHVISAVEAGNLVSFGALGVAVDLATGSLWKLEPEKIAITLCPVNKDKVHFLADRLNSETLDKSLNELEEMRKEQRITQKQYLAIKAITIHCVHPEDAATKLQKTQPLSLLSYCHLQL